MNSPHLSRISWVLPFFFGPLFYVYVRKLTQAHAAHSWKDSLHFIPAVAYTLYLLPYMLKTADEKRAIISSPEFLGEAFYWDELKVVQSLIYLFACFRILKLHRQAIKHTFSNIEYVRLQWLTYFIYFLLLVWGISFLTVQFSLLPMSENFEPVILVYVVASFGFYLLGYMGMNQPLIFNPGIVSPISVPAPASENVQSILQDGEANGQKEKYSRSGLSLEQVEVYSALLSSVMANEKPYLQNDLTIDQLSDSLHIPKHHLSQVINDTFKMNFYDYINSFRVQEAKELLLSPKYKDQTILSLAFEAGFNSKTTFNTVFKKTTGLTPSQYAKNPPKLGSYLSVGTTGD
jgi:AraC-like DNA-binding protein